MNLLYNDYQKIRQDNKDENAKLKPENRKSIERMTEYISYHSMSLFELEVIKKDLIGLAAEAEEEGVYFKTKLGMKEMEFCDSLLEDSKKMFSFERALLLARNLSIFVCIVTVYFYITLGFPEKFGVITGILVAVSILTVMLELIGYPGILRKKSVYKRAKADIKSVIVLVLGLGIFLFFTCNLPKPMYAWMHGDGRVVTGVTVAVTVIIYLLNSFYWNKQSEKYNWK